MLLFSIPVKGWNGKQTNLIWKCLMGFKNVFYLILTQLYCCETNKFIVLQDIESTKCLQLLVLVLLLVVDIWSGTTIQWSYRQCWQTFTCVRKFGTYIIFSSFMKYPKFLGIIGLKRPRKETHVQQTLKLKLTEKKWET